jgi:hypothetical protein
MNNDIKLTDLLKATAKHSVRQIKIKYARTKKQGVSDIPPSGGTGLRASTTYP